MLKATLQKWAVISNDKDLAFAKSRVRLSDSGNTLDIASLYMKPGGDLKWLFQNNQRIYIVGEVHGSKDHADGEMTAFTSQIREVADDLSYVITHSGSKYGLGEMYHQ